MFFMEGFTNIGAIILMEYGDTPFKNFRQPLLAISHSNL